MQPTDKIAIAMYYGSPNFELSSDEVLVEDLIDDMDEFLAMNDAERSAAIKSAAWDYLNESVQMTLEVTVEKLD